MEDDPVSQGRHAEQADHVGDTDTHEEVQGVGRADHHHAWLPAPPTHTGDTGGSEELETDADTHHIE